MATYSVGDKVFLASGGVGTVRDLASRDAQGRPARWRPEEGSPAFYVVDAGEVVACVPVAQAEQSLRPIVSPTVADELLAILRAEEPPVPSAEPILERGKRVAHSGTPFDHARLLRELYALPVPVAPALAEGLRFYEKLVLPELAQVLGLPLKDLQEELSTRHPAAADARRSGVLRW